jgi:hypothetical protein
MTGPIRDLDAWAAHVVIDPPAPTDDDRLADWAIRATTPAKPQAGANA